MPAHPFPVDPEDPLAAARGLSLDGLLAMLERLDGVEEAAVARVLAVFDDLLLGSNVLGMLRAGGYEASLGGADARPEGAVALVVTCNAQPYSHHDWHWRIIVAHHFGHAAAPEAVHGTLRLIDEAGIAGQLVLRDVRQGRAEVVPDWGRGESFRQEFRRLRAQ